MTDTYADAGLHYLPIERIDEFPECKNGKPILVLDCNLIPKEYAEIPIVTVWTGHR